MGTVFSNPLTEPFFGNNDQGTSMSKEFERGLRKHMKRHSSTASIRRRLSNGILENSISVSTTELIGSKSNLIASKRNERSKSKPHTSTWIFPPQAENSTATGSKASLDINKNPTTEKTSESSKTSVIMSSKDDIMSQNQNTTDRPFQPEAWPSLEMLHEHLSKHRTSPSTIIFARFRPKHSRKYVEIRYSITEATNEIVFETSGKLEELATPKDGIKIGNSTVDQMEYFLLIFRTCMNNLQGQVWWNGFSLILDVDVNSRLKVCALEAQPKSQLLYELTGMKELEVHRTSHRVELKGDLEGDAENMPKISKYLRFRGVDTKYVQVKQLRGNLITVHIPEFAPASIVY